MSALDIVENPRAVIGGNYPPSDATTAYERAKKAVDDIYDETTLWLDGHPIDSQELADGVGNLLTKIREAEKLADAARAAEKSPLDEQIAEIQTRYAPLIANTKTAKGKTVIAAAACKAALEPWLKKVAGEIEAKAECERQEADAKRRAAEEAIRAAEATNLAQRAAAEALLKEAKKAERIASKSEQRIATAGGAMGKATGLRTVWTATIADPIAFGRFAWSNHRDEYEAFLQALAERLVRSGSRSLPGVTISEEKRAV